MNVTEAVDFLSAMFHPSEQRLQPRLPVPHFSYRVSAFIYIPYSLLSNVALIQGNSVNEHVSLANT